MINVSNKVFIRHKAEINAFVTMNALTLKKGNYAKYIGAFITKSGAPGRGLDPDEESEYLPRVLGISSKSVDWETVLKNYWNNIRKMVPDTSRGLELEIGFSYENEEHKNLGETAVGIDELSCQHRQKYGKPINVEDYVLYRYCLRYPDVAKSIDDVHKSNRIRFYIFTQRAENRIKHDKVQVRRLAQVKLQEIWGDRPLIKNILSVYERFDVTDEIEQDVILDELVSSDPEKFLSIVTDPQLQMRSFVQKCLREGTLTRIGNTEGIKCDGVVLGYNVEEVVASLESSKYSDLKQRLQIRMRAVPSLNEQVITNTTELRTGAAYKDLLNKVDVVTEHTLEGNKPLDKITPKV
jgi:hypothetical protein